MTALLAELRTSRENPAGMRVLMDLRPLQEPERMPITAAYLERLMSAYAAHPVVGEEIVAILRTLRPDATRPLVNAGLEVVGRRWLLPLSRAPRTAALAADALQLRLAQLRTSPRIGEPVAGTVLHTAGGPAPMATRLPLVTTLLDLAAWELPDRYASTRAARVARGLREKALRAATRVLVGSRATAEATARLIDVGDERLAIVPLAPDPAFVPTRDPGALSRIRAQRGVPERFLIVGGRFDARSDLATVLGALRALRTIDPPSEAAGEWPPTLVLVGAAGADGGGRVARLAERQGVPDLVRMTPVLSPAEHATLTAGAQAHVQPALSDATGMAALDALSVGTPVIASRTGPLPEIVGSAGIVVEPRDPARMAMALRAMWLDNPVAAQVRRAARQRAAVPGRSWADVALETRSTYESAVGDNAVG
jgi:glycosyltransferase involved in cell wall biosynthesis